MMEITSLGSDISLPQVIIYTNLTHHQISATLSNLANADWTFTAAGHGRPQGKASGALVDPCPPPPGRPK